MKNKLNEGGRLRHVQGMLRDVLWIVDYAWQFGEDGLVYTCSWLSQ